MTQAYPLKWPEGRARRTPAQRKTGKFNKRTEHGYAGDLSVFEALKRLQGELDRIGGRYAVVSSNVETRLDGLPRSGAREPQDPGVAVYFHLGDKAHCLPCDTYSTVAANIAAVAAHIEATRAIERHGVATVQEMFSGFAALPPPEPPKPKWWEVLGVQPDSPKWMIDAAYKHRAKTAHPDAGGSAAEMAQLNAAKAEADKEHGNG
jgi:hypothetical protein